MAKMVLQINVLVYRFSVIAFALKQNIKQNLKKNKIWVFFVKFKCFQKKGGGVVVSERDRQCNEGIGKRVHDVYKC